MAKTAKKKRASVALARRADVAPVGPEQPLAIIERVAKDKDVDVEKLGKLIDLQKDMLRTQAKIDFDQAFAEMAPLLPTIRKGGTITNKDKSPRSRYARLSEDIHPVVKPLLSRHGFAIRHRTEWPEPGRVRVIGILSHRSGHSEESAFEGPADTSDYRSHVQSLGSTVSYGRRYTTIDLLNLTVNGTDDDGQKAGHPGAGTTPPRRETVSGDERATHAGEGERITQAQRQRLVMIVNNSDRSDVEVNEWLRTAYGITNVKPTRDILVRDYNAITRALEAPGPLPKGRAS